MARKMKICAGLFTMSLVSTKRTLTVFSEPNLPSMQATHENKEDADEVVRMTNENTSSGNTDGIPVDGCWY